MDTRKILIDSQSVPIPKARTGPHAEGKNLKYPFKKLKVGESFLVVGVPARNISACASYAGKVLGRKFVVRSMDGGVRVWRVKGT